MWVWVGMELGALLKRGAYVAPYLKSIGHFYNYTCYYGNGRPVLGVGMGVGGKEVGWYGGGSEV